MKITIVVSVICVVISFVVIYSIIQPQNDILVLSYYVEDIPYSHKPTTKNMITNATNSWEKVNPKLKFKQADSKEDADIEIDWTKYISNDRIGHYNNGNLILWDCLNHPII